MKLIERFYVFRNTEYPELPNRFLGQHGFAIELKSDLLIRGDTVEQLLRNVRKYMREVELCSLFSDYQIDHITQVVDVEKASLKKRELDLVTQAKQIQKAFDTFETLRDNYTIADEYAAYHRRGGPKTNKYNIAINLDLADLDEHVRELPPSERKALVGVYEYWDEAKLPTYFLKPLGIRFPDCKYGTENEVVFFKEKSQAMLFKLTYGFSFDVVDFAEIYEAVT